MHCSNGIVINVSKVPIVVMVLKPSKRAKIRVKLKQEKSFDGKWCTNEKHVALRTTLGSFGEIYS